MLDSLYTTRKFCSHSLLPFLSWLFQGLLYENWSLLEPNCSIPLPESRVLDVYSKLNKTSFRHWLSTCESRNNRLNGIVIWYFIRRNFKLIGSFDPVSKNEVKYCTNSGVLLYRLINKRLRAGLDFLNRIKRTNLLIYIACCNFNWFCDNLVSFAFFSKLSQLWYSLIRPLYL